MIERPKFPLPTLLPVTTHITSLSVFLERSCSSTRSRGATYCTLYLRGVRGVADQNMGSDAVSRQRKGCETSLHGILGFNVVLALPWFSETH
jgi:hypothetical protein